MSFVEKEIERIKKGVVVLLKHHGRALTLGRISELLGIPRLSLIFILEELIQQKIVKIKQPALFDGVPLYELRGDSTD